MKRFLIVLVMVLAVMSILAVNGVSVASQEMSAITGKVVETMNSGGYTYVCLEKSNKKIWVAIPQTMVKKGQTMSLYPGVEMTNFESKTLKRKFDKIIFLQDLLNSEVRQIVTCRTSITMHQAPHLSLLAWCLNSLHRSGCVHALYIYL